MNRFCLLIVILSLGYFNSYAQQVINPETPDTLKKALPEINTTPQSELDIPVRIDLKPFYRFANQFIDTLYTSPNYPYDWVQEECDVRYQYRFVRGPFGFAATNNVLLARFSGFYGVRGSTRFCTGMGNSPWTPSCSCGFGTEPPRRMDAGFVTSFKLMPDYRLGVNVKLMEPSAVDKCSVCFFGKDITYMVAAQLKSEMTASINDMQKQLESFSLKSYIQTVWDTLQAPYPIPGFGYLNMQPSALRISQAVLRQDSMFFSIGVSAKPELKSTEVFQKKPLPNITDFSQRGGFSLFISQILPYDSLNALANEQAAGKEFTAGKGLFKKTVRIDSIRLLGGGEKIFIQMYLSRAIKGVVYLEGKPVWDSEKKLLEIKGIDYEIKSKQLLVKSAAYLLDGQIENKLKEYTRFDLAAKAEELKIELMKQMNREITSGIRSKGEIEKLLIEKLIAQPEGIYIAGLVKGKLWLDIDAGAMIKTYLQ